MSLDDVIVTSVPDFLSTDPTQWTAAVDSQPTFPKSDRLLEDFLMRARERNFSKGGGVAARDAAAVFAPHPRAGTVGAGDPLFDQFMLRTMPDGPRKAA